MKPYEGAEQRKDGDYADANNAESFWRRVVGLKK
jgi:hypothetical protein